MVKVTRNKKEIKRGKNMYKREKQNHKEPNEKKKNFCIAADPHEGCMSVGLTKAETLSRTGWPSSHASLAASILVVARHRDAPVRLFDRLSVCGQGWEGSHLP